MLSVVVAVALATAASPFDDAKKSATAVDRLASTVAALVGVCPDGLIIDELQECQKNLATAAKNFAGKKVYVYFGAIEPAFLAFESKTGDRAKLVWAPLLDLGNGLALTVGKPDKLSDKGNVVVSRKPFEGASDPELLDSDLERAVKTGQVGVEVVATFGKPWQLNGKGQIVRGVPLQLSALRFFHSRTGKPLLEINDLK
ncbi:MAG: DUF6066 family protein [Deltaproteobacteria bacterium]|nr:DUF6066 family protein [Deltaproteobacteria bacterium]